jgi:hypothetical protein
VHTETFVAGGEDVSVATKAWMTETVPELHRLSADDICIKSDDLCVVYINTEKPGEDTMAMLKGISKKLMNKGDRGASVKFMWLSTTDEPDFAKIFPNDSTPALGVLKTGKRNRYIMHEGDLTEDAVV